MIEHFFLQIIFSADHKHANVVCISLSVCAYESVEIENSIFSSIKWYELFIYINYLYAKRYNFIYYLSLKNKTHARDWYTVWGLAFRLSVRTEFQTYTPDKKVNYYYYIDSVINNTQNKHKYISKLICSYSYDIR
jgi:hypothetical protein